MKEDLRKALLQIAQDGAQARPYQEGVPGPGGQPSPTAKVQTNPEQISFGAFLLASDWHHKLLSRTPGNWKDHRKHDFIGVALSSAFAIFATELLHYESGINDKALLDQSVANIFCAFKATYPQAQLREVWEAAFGFKKGLRSSSDPNAIRMRESLAQLVLNEALNRVSKRLPAEKIETSLFGLYDTFRRAIAPTVRM